MKLRDKSYFQNGFAAFGVVMVVATITLIGFVAFRFLAAQDNSEVATTDTAYVSQVANIETIKDVETVTSELDTAELDSLDADLNSEFDF